MPTEKLSRRFPISPMRLFCLLPLTAVLGGVAPYVCAQEDDGKPSVYGRLNISEVLNRPESGGHDPEFVSNASRLGIEGSIPFAESLEIIYQAEYEIKLDHGYLDSDFTSQRNTFVGVSGDFGTVLVGRYDTPVRLIQNRVDLFNDMRGDIRSLVVGENRPNDILHYASPEFGGFAVTFSAIVDGKSGLYDRLTRSTSTAITYTADRFFAGVGVDNNVDGNDIVRLVTQYTLGPVRLGVLYEKAEDAASNQGDQDGIVASVTYTVDQWVFKAQSGTSDLYVENGRVHSVGVDYLLNDASRLFGFMTATRSDARLANNDQYGIGYEYRF